MNNGARSLPRRQFGAQPLASTVEAVVVEVDVDVAGQRHLTLSSLASADEAVVV